MILDVFHCLNDHKLINSSLFCHKNIYSRNIRAIHDEYFFDHGVVLLSHHPTNARVIEYIRSKNVLTPIFLISEKPYYYPSINGFIHPKDLTYSHLLSLMNLFPQRFIWNYVFQKDHQRRNFLLCRQ